MYEIPDTPICERGNDLIAFLYAEIDERGQRDFERHLLNCGQCESQLSAFKQIQSSVVAWRHESLGGVTPNSVLVSPAVARASDPGKPSAIAAIRNFFELSPSWMKGSVAFAAVLFCIVSAIALAHLFDKPKPVIVADEKRYTQQELLSKIEDAVKSRRQEWETQQARRLPLNAVDTNPKAKAERRTPGSSERVAANPKVRRGPLTKSEREQLAADLRLIPQDDTDLDLLGDGNQ